MNDAHKIAVFRKDAYMLYVAKMTRHSMLLLFLWTLVSPKFASIADVTYNGAFRLAGEDFGKNV